MYLLAAKYDLEIVYVHNGEKNYVVADFLSRSVPTPENILKIGSHIPDPLWVNVSNDVLELDNDI